MEAALQPIQAISLKDVFIERFEALILSGQFAIGQRLPPERDLAIQLGVSRPVVHEGLVELAARGLVEIRPRVGTFVCDYRRDGSLALLNSLVSYGQGRLEPGLLTGLLDLRMLFEVETARLAAGRRTEADLDALSALVDAEAAADPADPDGLADLDFRFHHQLCLASGNPIYPLLIKSFEPAYKNLTRLFFLRPGAAAKAHGFHQQLIQALRAWQPEQAAAVMRDLLTHGAQVLSEALDERE